MTDYRQFWVFEVVGGDPFRTQIQGNPVQTHDGTRSVIRCLILDDQVENVKAHLGSFGGTVTLANSPREDEDAKEQRRNLLNVLGDNPVLPCARCPECSWLDPYMTGLCGAGRNYDYKETWSGFAEQLRVPKYLEDYNACPIPVADSGQNDGS